MNRFATPHRSSGEEQVSRDPARTQFGEDQCDFSLDADVKLGPGSGLSFQGMLSVVLQDDGAIDSGVIVSADGQRHPVVGQAKGRSVRLRVDLGEDGVLTLTGSASRPFDQCTGELTGAFSGPAMQDIGVWSAVGQGALGFTRER